MANQKVVDNTGYKDIRQVEKQCLELYGANAGFVVFYSDKAGFSDGGSVYSNISNESEVLYSDSRLSGAFGTVRFATTATDETKAIVKATLTSANFNEKVF